MSQLFDFFYSNLRYIAWGIVIILVLVFALPRWIRLNKMRVLYRKKKYDLCLSNALRLVENNPFPKSRTVILSYVLSCSLALNKKDIFLNSISRITSIKPWYKGVRLTWETVFHLDQFNIEEAVNNYKLLCSIDDQRARNFAKSIGDVFAHYDLSRPFSKDEIRKKMDAAIHPALYRIYSKINDNIQ